MTTPILKIISLLEHYVIPKWHRMTYTEHTRTLTEENGIAEIV